MIEQGIGVGIRQGIRQGIDGSAPTLQAVGAQGASAAGFQVAWPTHQKGDIGILFVKTQGGQVATLSDAQGFVAVTGGMQDVGTGVGSARLTLFWCRATSSSMTGPTLADTGNHHIARIVTARGCTAGGNPWDVVAGDTVASDTAVSIPGATTTRHKTLVIAAVGDGFDGAGARASSAANASLSGVTEQADDGSTAGTGGGLVIISGTKLVAGTYSATTCTLANAGGQARISIALKGP